MKKEEVPQDKSNLSKSNLKELCYATDQDGKYTTALSSGWEPKTIALDQSMKEVNQRVEMARQKVIQGISSPILYYMEYHKMDWQTLSSYVGMWQWRVKRHTKPKIFSKLKPKTLSKYAIAFGISIEELKNYKGE